MGKLKLEGLGGWLILYQIWVWYGVVYRHWGFIVVPFLIFFYLKKRWYKWINLFIMGFYTILGIASLIKTMNMQFDFSEWTKSLIEFGFPLFWIFYFFLSENAEKTFVK